MQASKNAFMIQICNHHIHKSVEYQAFFWTSEKKTQGKKTQALKKTTVNFPKKKLKKFSKYSQIRQIPPDLVASEIFTGENVEK